MSTLIFAYRHTLPNDSAGSQGVVSVWSGVRPLVPCAQRPAAVAEAAVCKAKTPKAPNDQLGCLAIAKQQGDTAAPSTETHFTPQLRALKTLSFTTSALKLPRKPTSDEV